MGFITNRDDLCTKRINPRVPLRGLTIKNTNLELTVEEENMHNMTSLWFSPKLVVNGCRFSTSTFTWLYCITSSLFFTYPTTTTTLKLCLTYALISSSSSSINQSHESIAVHSPLKHFPSKAVIRVLFMPLPVHIWSVFLTCHCSP